MSGVDQLVDAIDRLTPPRLLVFDCDGVLAPLTDHADDSVLLDGVGDDLKRLAALADTTVAILSGRSLAGLEQFGFGDGIVVAGSYGAERRGAELAPLGEHEQRRLAALDAIAVEAVDSAGPGAWVERKPASVVIHVRTADAERGAAAIATAWAQQSSLDGHGVHRGSNVLELMARPTDKGRGLSALRAEFAPGATVYVGDDVPDEDAFAVLGPGDISVKVGPGSTVATHRVDDAPAMAEVIRRLAGSEQR